MLGYDSELRKLTSGTASFSLEYAEHQEMTEAQSETVKPFGQSG